MVHDHSVTRHGVVLLCGNAEGVEFIARVAELLPDVVLMDVDMPRRDGICAIKQIRQDHPLGWGGPADSARGSGESSGRSRQVPVGWTTTLAGWPGCRRPEG